MHSPDVTAAVATIHYLPDEAATQRFGALLAACLRDWNAPSPPALLPRVGEGSKSPSPACGRGGGERGGLVVYLEGDLGSGKTTLARALIHALGHAGPVKSPSYSLVEVYVVSSLYLYHFDFYRFESPEEFLDAGFGEYFNAGAICLVEWPERATGCVPPPDLRLCLRHEGRGRVLETVVDSREGAQCLEGLASAWSAGNRADNSSALPAPR